MAEGLNCCALIFMFCLIAGVIALDIFTIIALIEDYDESMNQCKSSSIWVSLLLLIVLSPGLNNLTKTSEGELNPIGVFIYILFLMFFCIWIALETTTTCSALQGTMIIVVGECWVAFISFILGLITISILFFCRLAFLSKITENDEQEITQEEMLANLSRAINSRLGELVTVVQQHEIPVADASIMDESSIGDRREPSIVAVQIGNQIP